MSATIIHSQTLVTMNCGVDGCGIAFAIPDSLHRKANDDHATWFWCPNGHKIHFLGKSDRQRAEEKASDLERRLANAQEDTRATHASLVATKGHLTRVKRRADAGVCQHCRRSFANVARHMEDKHPNEKEGK